MPPLFPTAICMALELGTYGFAAGFMHRILPRKKTYIYLSLITAMLAGRVVWGISTLLCLGLSGGQFTFSAFIVGAFTNAIPGIVLQILLIPFLMFFLETLKLSPVFKEKDK